MKTHECVIQTQLLYIQIYIQSLQNVAKHTLLLYIHTISPYFQESLLLQNIQYRSPWQAPHFRVLGDDFRTLFIRLLLREDAVIREI